MTDGACSRELCARYDWAFAEGWQVSFYKDRWSARTGDRKNSSPTLAAGQADLGILALRVLAEINRRDLQATDDFSLTLLAAEVIAREDKAPAACRAMNRDRGYCHKPAGHPGEHDYS